MDTRISRSPEETYELGRAWGSQAKAGQVLGLSGDLGAGKTHFAKGVAAGLGITSKVQSPTFSLVQEYREGRLPLFHLDLYRLDSVQEIQRAGLDAYLYQPDGVTLVEWIERWTEKVPGMLLVRFEQVTEVERKLTYEPARA